MRKKIEPKISEDELRRIVAISKCKKDLLRHFDLDSGHHYRIINRLLKKFNIDISHFVGRAWNKGQSFPDARKTPLSEILVVNSTYTNTNKLRKRLIKEKIFEERCCNCKNTEWMGGKIPLELEHKNGIKNDHRQENLELRCPNCHALTRYYRGRNIKNKPF